MNHKLRFSEIREAISKLPNNAFRSSTKASTLILYSGRKGKNRSLAENAVAFDPMEKFSIHETEAGKYLESLNLYGQESGMKDYEADQIWSIASQRLVENAHGNIETYVIDASHNKVFRGTELHNALANANVESINGVACDHHMGHYDPDAIYASICKSELDRDNARLASAFDGNLRQSLNERQHAFRRWQQTGDTLTQAEVENRGQADLAFKSLMEPANGRTSNIDEKKILEAEIEAEISEATEYDFGQEIGLSPENEI